MGTNGNGFLVPFPNADRLRFHLLSTGSTSDTAATYVARLAIFKKWQARAGIDDESCSRADVEAFLADELGRVARNTVAGRLAALRAYFDHLGRPEVTAGLKIRREKVAPERPFTDWEIEQLMWHCESARDRAMMRVALECNVRISELCGLRGEDIDLKDGMLKVRGKGAKQRWLTLSGAAKEALLPFVRPGPIWLLDSGAPLKPAEAKRRLWRLSRRAGVNAHWHRFRTTFACRFLARTHDLDSLQTLMGHASADTTRRYAEFEQRDRALAQMRGTE